MNSSRNRRPKPRGRQSASGQIIIEYILLLFIVVAIAAIVTKTMIGSDKANAGFVLEVWSQINGQVGADKADDVVGAKK